MSTWANSSEVESIDASLKLSPDQESTLDCHFRRNKNMHPSDVSILSAETGLPEQQVQVRHPNKIFLGRNTPRTILGKYTILSTNFLKIFKEFLKNPRERASQYISETDIKESV